jgi:predicted nucleic acid-binding Zn ribbon protein
VGAAIARHAWPSRIGRDGTVHVNTADSVWAFELAQRSAEIATRLGASAVRFAPGPLAEPEPESSRRRASEPSPEQRRKAARIASCADDENLRKSIERAVSLGLAAGGSDLPV